MWCRLHNRTGPALPGRSPARREGFTLIELVISMALLSVVLGLVYTAFFQISGQAGQLQETMNEEQEMRLLLRLVADDLMAAQFLTRHGAAGNDTGIQAEIDQFDGEDFSEIHFHAAVPARFYRGIPPEKDPRLHEVAYWVENNLERTGLDLWRREDFYIDDDVRTGGISVVLREGITSFTVEFLRPPATDQLDPPENWVPRWASSGNVNDDDFGLPQALRLTLGVAGKEAEPLTASMTVNLPPSLEVLP